jgi:Prp8 binding protein
VVLFCSFSPSFFLTVLWNIFDECKNYNVLSGHKSAVLQAKWISDVSIISGSADKTVAIWDANSGKRVRKFSHHTGIVNTVSVAKDSPNMVKTLFPL